MVPRKLSSSFHTWFNRIAATLALTGLALDPFWFSSVKLPPNIFLKVLLALMFAAFLYACVLALRVKIVELDGNDLLISYFGKRIRVPLNAVAAVEGGLGGSPIKLEFRIATDFGESIKFVPPQRSMWPWQRHPLVKELRGLARLNGDT
jgi:hypothetical protein